MLEESKYQKLRKSYNAFLSLLDLPYENLYKCKICGPNIKNVVFDGIAMGGRKNKLPKIASIAVPDVIVKGSTIHQQVFIQQKTTRNLLNDYATVGKGGRYSQDIKAMNEVDFQSLCDSLNNYKSLQDIIIVAGNPCPEYLRKLVGELSRNTPTVGMLQLCEDNQAYHILKDIANNGLGQNILRTVYENQATLEKSCPLLMSFLFTEEIGEPLKVELLKDILQSVNAPFVEAIIPDNNCYGPPQEASEKLSFFPNHPLRRGKANYESNSVRDRSSNSCRKWSQRSSALNPGIFTMFCPHGICLGFQLMIEAESPRTPFEILVQRFQTMPERIIYDNACKLHQYALKREPARFRKTMFLVDTFHYQKNHVACSLGYGMREYPHDEFIQSINSQVCEQGNRDLRKLSVPAAYMNPENLIQQTKVFLALRNMQRLVHQ